MKLHLQKRCGRGQAGGWGQSFTPGLLLATAGLSLGLLFPDKGVGRVSQSRAGAGCCAPASLPEDSPFFFTTGSSACFTCRQPEDHPLTGFQAAVSESLLIKGIRKQYHPSGELQGIFVGFFFFFEVSVIPMGQPMQMVVPPVGMRTESLKHPCKAVCLFIHL